MDLLLPARLELLFVNGGDVFIFSFFEGGRRGELISSSSNVWPSPVSLKALLLPLSTLAFVEVDEVEGSLGGDACGSSSQRQKSF